jgi:glutamate synthase domain-containing protein 1
MSTLYLTITPTVVKWQIGTRPTESIPHNGSVAHALEIVEYIKQDNAHADVTVFSLDHDYFE